MCEASGYQMQESDESLVSRLQGGDAGAFDALFERYSPGLQAFVYGLAGDRGMAEDITQECFIKLVRRIQRIQPEKGVSGWLYRVARNRTLDILRRRKRLWLPAGTFFRRCADRAASSRGVPGEQMQKTEEADQLARLLDSLPRREREVLVMHYFGDLTFREVAATLRRPLGTVLYQARRGIRKLRALYGSLEP